MKHRYFAAPFEDTSNMPMCTFWVCNWSHKVPLCF